MTQLRATIQGHLEMLSNTIGPRPSASAGCHAAADYVSRQMQHLGLEVETQFFDCPAWQCDAAQLWAGDRSLAVLPNPYSPSCDVQAPLVPVATLAELKSASLSGKIAFLYGDLTHNPLACKSWFLKEERDEQIISLLEQKAPLAVLTVQVRPGSINRIIEDWEFVLPSATLPAESALVLISQPPEMVHLSLQTRSKPGSSANIVGRRAGRRPEQIVLCAHYDTKIDTPGAGDNAGGVAALLGLAEHLASIPIEAGLEFVAFSNEEYLPIGDDTYLDRAGADYLNRVLLAINFDGPGFILDANSLAIFASSAAFKEKVTEISRAFPAVQWVDPWPESNHSTFAMRGVPALAFSSRALWQYAHQLDDTSRWISPARLEEAVQLSAQIIQDVQYRPLAWLRSEAENSHH
jgi:aminopeptidase YwaD